MANRFPTLLATLLGCLVTGHWATAQQAATPTATTATATATTATPTTAATPVAVPKPQLHEHPTLVAMWQRNNQLRASAGRPPVAMSPTLTKAAQDHAWFMANSGQFSHEGNGGMVGRVRKYGGTHGSLSENIAWNQQSVAGVFQSWQNSPGHWSNICSNCREAGFGYAIGRNGQTYWVAVFGSP
jgi:uncharacterized protein YkwD